MLYHNEAFKTQQLSTSILHDLLTCGRAWRLHLTRPGPICSSLRRWNVSGSVRFKTKGNSVIHGQEELIVVYCEEMVVIELEITDRLFNLGFSDVRPVI